MSIREVEAGTELDIKGSSPASQSVPIKGSYHHDDDDGGAELDTESIPPDAFTLISCLI